jgi:hypothetical protein
LWWRPFSRWREYCPLCDALGFLCSGCLAAAAWALLGDCPLYDELCEPLFGDEDGDLPDGADA